MSDELSEKNVKFAYIGEIRDKRFKTFNIMYFASFGNLFPKPYAISLYAIITVFMCDYNINLFKSNMITLIVPDMMAS